MLARIPVADWAHRTAWAGVGGLDEEANVELELGHGQDGWMPRRICFSVSRANQRSTWLIQDAEGGVDVVAGRLGKPGADELRRVSGRVVQHEIGGGAPGRGSRCRVLRRCRANRSRHLSTVW